ncbi:hypothetical protein ZIOFF_009678 [Zingiber officinale]|uniref:Wbp11/ELF5/Saf1 N-terminal domain-containing protein n=1 Tax=Zingiber officinale TaxID=94328 RepID=A0A8J5LXN1_ZINOF|nr:hypothetical protein ZIOFF_009678 [Zingiber officinale]
MDASTLVQIDPLHWILDMNSLVGDAYHDVRELCVFLLLAAASSFPPSKALAVYFQPLVIPSSFVAPSTLPAHLLSSPSPGLTLLKNPPFLTLTQIPSSSRSPPPRSASRSRASPPCHLSLTPARRRRPSDSLLGLARTSSISCSPSAGLTEVGSSCPWISLTGGSRSSRSEPRRIPVISKILPCDRQVNAQSQRYCSENNKCSIHFSTCEVYGKTIGSFLPNDHPLRKNKKERKKVCEVDILKKDPEAIREQIEKLERMSILIVLFFLD